MNSKQTDGAVVGNLEAAPVLLKSAQPCCSGMIDERSNQSVTVHCSKSLENSAINCFNDLFFTEWLLD
jgi:hypothetical protein